MASKKKLFSLTVGKIKLTFLKADVEVNDGMRNAFGERYNHPMIRLKSTEKYNGYDRLTIWIRFQRHLLGGEGLKNPAVGFTDTQRCWSVCYAGQIEKDSSAFLLDSHNAENLKDKFQRKLVEKIQQAVDTYNLRHVEPDCDLKRTVKALESIGVGTQWWYKLDYGKEEEGIQLFEVENRGANAKKARENL